MRSIYVGRKRRSEAEPAALYLAHHLAGDVDAAGGNEVYAARYSAERAAEGVGHAGEEVYDAPRRDFVRRAEVEDYRPAAGKAVGYPGRVRKLRGLCQHQALASAGGGLALLRRGLGLLGLGAVFLVAAGQVEGGLRQTEVRGLGILLIREEALAPLRHYRRAGLLLLRRAAVEKFVLVVVGVGQLFNFVEKSHLPVSPQRPVP